MLAGYEVRRRTMEIIHIQGRLTKKNTKLTKWMETVNWSLHLVELQQSECSELNSVLRDRHVPLARTLCGSRPEERVLRN